MFLTINDNVCFFTIRNYILYEYLTKKKEVKKMRYRNVFLFILVLLPLSLFLVTDPDSGLIDSLQIGAGLLGLLTMLAVGLLGLALLHFSRKGLHDYDTSDINLLGKIAVKDPRGAGLQSIATAILTLAYALVVAAAILGTLLT